MAENETQSSSYGKKPLWQWIAIYAVVAAILYGGYYYLVVAKSKNNTTSSLYGGATPTTQNTNQQRFADSPVASMAYQIYPGSLSDKAKTAMAGFKMETKNLDDGSVQVNLTSTNPEYKNQQVVVKQGYTLYFVEKNAGDDDETKDSDRTVVDDTTVLVDPSGFIVE